MKKLFIFFIVLLPVIGSAQDRSINLEYTVTYEFPNNKKRTVDTVKVSFDRAGAFLYSNLELFTDEIGTSILRYMKYDENSVVSDVVYDTSASLIFMNLQMNENVMFFKMNIRDFVPTNSVDGFDDDITIIAEKAKTKTQLMGKRYSTYYLYPDHEPESILTVVLDESKPVSNYNIFNSFFQLMLQATDSSGSIAFNIPDGLILSISDKNSTWFSAIGVESNPIQINMSHSFNVKE